MGQSIKAFLQGYIIFKVNGRFYPTYTSARNARLAVPASKDVSFIGLHCFLGWRSFYLRVMVALPEGAN